MFKSFILISMVFCLINHSKAENNEERVLKSAVSAAKFSAPNVGPKRAPAAVHKADAAHTADINMSLAHKGSILSTTKATTKIATIALVKQSAAKTPTATTKAKH